IMGNVAQGGNGLGQYYTAAKQGGSGYGGGMFNLNGTVVLFNCMIISNSPIAGMNNLLNGIVFSNTPTGAADGGALYNLAFGNRIEDGSLSVADVTLSNTVIAASLGGTNDLANNVINGNQVNVATVTFLGGNLVTSQTNISTATSTGPSPSQPALVPATPGLSTN